MTGVGYVGLSLWWMLHASTIGFNGSEGKEMIKLKTAQLARTRSSIPLVRQWFGTGFVREGINIDEVIDR